jgi:hypothetical protein
LAWITMPHPFLTRLLDDAAWRMSRTGTWLIVLAFAAFAALFCLFRAWNTFDLFIANDATTLIYAHYARNLLRYPLSETFGLMADLVGNPAQALILGTHRTFYADHPPGLVWLIAIINRFMVADPVVASRVTSIIASTGTGMMLLTFVYRRVSPLPAVAATFVLMTLNLYWEHAVVGNFEPVTAFFMVGAAIAFVRYLRQPTPVGVAATALVWVAGMLCDWPAYLLGAPFAAALLYRRKWGAFLLFAGLGIGTMAAVFAHLLLGGTGMSVATFFYDTFHHSAGHMPFPEALASIYALLLRGFSWWALFLILPLPVLFRRTAVGAEMGELRFVYLAFLFAGLANDLLFNQWAKDHSFWSYYLIPAACIGAAMAFQLLQETRFRPRAVAVAVRVAVPTLFVIGVISIGWNMIFFMKSHFHQPIAISQMLDERGLQDMLARDSMLLVSPDCGDRPSGMDDARYDGKARSGCDIYSGAGSLARYVLDKAAIPASDYDAARGNCDKAFAIVKDPGAAARLGPLAAAATEVPWFQWHVVRLSRLASSYCENPAQVFAP